MAELLKIAVVDDDHAIREGMEVILQGPQREIVLFEGGEAFMEAVDTLSPDIVFVDLKMPGMTGMEVLQKLEGHNGLAKVMISGHGDIATAVQALKFGAATFVEKPFTPEEIEAVIEEVQAGDEADPAASAAEEVLSVLTPRETDVALALNKGLSNKEVARELDLSPRTVEIHRAKVFEKLQVRNLAGLVKLLTKLNID